MKVKNIYTKFFAMRIRAKLSLAQGDSFSFWFQGNLCDFVYFESLVERIKHRLQIFRIMDVKFYDLYL